MKNFALSVIASLVAAFILYIAPTITSFLSSEDVSITVSAEKEVFGEHDILHVAINNPTKYAIEPILFKSPKLTDTKIVAINGLDMTSSLDSFPKQGLSLLMPKGSTVFVRVVAKFDGALSDIAGNLSGQYSFINDTGRVETDKVKVKTLTEKRYEQLFIMLKWFLLIVAISTGVWVYIHFGKDKDKDREKTEAQ
ncbi:hypothetical protein C2F68_RS23190 [Vibrio parahaemolyticus]|nr:hypothetical protein [Vibrio parahaemolyticus]